ncbi:DnaJ family domain-containing protein [Serratia proteamaculans]
MSLLDQLAEKHILAALRQGELDNLPGSGRALQLDDDSHIPAELRASYRILKNSGFLPPELEMRREAIELYELLRTVDSEEECYQQQEKQLRLLEMKLKQAGICTDFLHGGYGRKVQQHFNEEQ